MDASALNAPSPTAVGIVALIGEAVGGAPYTAIGGREDISFFTTPAQLARSIPAGDLLEAANICFAPSTVTGGAQQVVALKANPSTQAHVTLQGSGGPVLTLKAQQWGLAGNSIRVSVSAGTTGGVALTLSDGVVVEQADNLGDDPVAKVTFEAAGGWTKVALAKDTAALTLSGTATVQPATGEIDTVVVTASSPITATPSQSDAGKTLVVYGITAAGDPVAETLVLGSGPTKTAAIFGKLLGAYLSDTAEGVALTDNAGHELATLGANVRHLGVADVGSLAVANAAVTITGQAAGDPVLIVGTQASGALQVDSVTTQPGAGVPTTKAFVRVDRLITGGLTQPAQVSALAARVPTAGGSTLRGAAGAIRAVKGVNLRLTAGDEDTPVAGLDAVPASQLGTDAVTLVSDVEAVVDWINGNSQLVTAAVVAGAKSQPSPTPSPVYLGGGTESPASAADYLACLDLLKLVRVNIVVPLTSDPAVAAATEAHCARMSGIGQSERMCHLGAMDSTLAKPASLKEVKQQAAALDSAYATLCPNGIIRFDTQGNLTQFAPHFTAAALAGMRAGARVNTPLTRKALQVIGVTQDPSYDPVDDADELIGAGVTFLRRFDALGICPVRDITTWTRDNNPLFSSGMVAYATGINVYTYRTALEQFVGQDDFSGGFNQIKVFAVQVLSQLRDARQIWDFDPPTGSRLADAILVDQSWQYDPETNFILPTIHLQNPQQAAA